MPEAISILQKILENCPNHFPTRIKLVEAHISLANLVRRDGSYAGYKNILENALIVCIDGFDYPTKSVWLYRFTGRILTLFMKDSISYDQELLKKALSLMKTGSIESDSEFLQDYKILGALFECSVRCIMISLREAREYDDLQAVCLYDLALCFYYGYLRQGKNVMILKKAVQIIRLCIEILPDSDMFWNTAGVFLQTLDLARSQHCFIKAAYLSNSVFFIKYLN